MSEILLVTGPTGAGKTTTCERFAKSADGVWACVSQDHLRTFVKAGFKNPAETWDDETVKQWSLSQAISGDILRRYQAAGINCVFDCFAPLGTFDEWDEALDGLQYKVIVLLPSIDARLVRNAQRSGTARLRPRQVREQHEWFEAWRGDDRATMLDTSNLTIAEVTKKVAQVSGR